MTKKKQKNKKKQTFRIIALILPALLLLLHFFDTWYLPISLLFDVLSTFIPDISLDIVSALFSFIYAIILVIAIMLGVRE